MEEHIWDSDESETSSTDANYKTHIHMHQRPEDLTKRLEYIPPRKYEQCVIEILE
jgi:hypothetical protein